MKHIHLMPRYIVDQKGIYEFITIIYSTFKDISNSSIVLDCSRTRYIDPNLMAPLGLVLTKLKSKSNEIFFSGMKPNFKDILIKYGFLVLNKIPNPNVPQNYIKYETFNGDDNDGFQLYLKEQLSEICNYEVISSLTTHIMEIFINVKMHARHNEAFSRFKTKEIFTSGFYNKREDFVIFSIANNGQTFIENITSNLNYSFSSEVEYIKWALVEKNTSTKDRPGGLGLAMIKDLVKECTGDLFILSGKGYYQYSYDANLKAFSEITTDFSSPFPGTVITIKLPIQFIQIYDSCYGNINFTIEELLQEDK